VQIRRNHRRGIGSPRNAGKGRDVAMVGGARVVA